jgi:rhodanese-related sulfurtransferase
MSKTGQVQSLSAPQGLDHVSGYQAKEFGYIILKHWRPILRWFLRRSDPHEITVEELHDRVNTDRPPLLIDVRFAPEYNGTDERSRYGHIPSARSIPILDLESSFEDLESYKEKEVVAMCQGGGLSLVAVDLLTKAGFKDVKSLRGGTDLWHEKGYPTATSQSPVTCVKVQ